VSATKSFATYRALDQRYNPHNVHVRWLKGGLNVHLPTLPPDSVTPEGGAVFHLDGPCLARAMQIGELKRDLFRRFEQPDGHMLWPLRSDRLDFDEDRLAAIGVLEQTQEGQRWWHVPGDRPDVVAFIEDRLGSLEWAHHKMDGEPCLCGSHREASLEWVPKELRP
jgi:hypothetical protein